MKSVFALDVDGTLLDLVQGALDYAEEKYGAILSHENVTDWDWDYAWSLPDGMTPEFWEKVWTTPATVHPGALEFLDNLRAEGYDPVLVSTRPNNWKGLGDIAYRAALRDFPQLGVDSIELVQANKEKAAIMEMYNAEYFLEDNPVNAAYCRKYGGVRSFLITRPWNERCICLNNDWTRVWDYNEIMRHITDPSLL